MVRKMLVLAMLVGPAAANWGDLHMRGSRGSPAAAARRRQLMDVEPGSGSMKWKMNGEEIDYSILQCPQDWVDKLDDTYLCLPKNTESGTPKAIEMFGPNFPNTIQPAPAGTADFKSVPFWCGNNGEPAADGSGCGGLCGATDMGFTCADQEAGLASERAAKDPFDSPPICETFIDDCVYSNDKTFGAYAFGGTETKEECTKKDSERQWLDCGIPCPVPFPMENLGGFAAVVFLFMAATTIGGFMTYKLVKNEVDNFFVAGRTLPLWIVTFTLASQSFDASAALGNVDLGYKYHWWDGAALPIGLGLSLIFNGLFLARHINTISAEEGMITLPDLFRLRYGYAAEVLASLVTLISFLFLLAGNLVGAGKILGFLLSVDSPILGIWIAAILIWLYTIAGGLFSVAYTDVGQAIVGWTGFIVGTIWILNNMPNHPVTSPAYPVGDKGMFWSQMTDGDALDPIPNAIVMNWATIFVLGFGNLMALDFQARVMAAQTPSTATWGNILAGLITWAIGIPFAYVSGVARALYGPSSPHAEFSVNTCSTTITVVGCYDYLDGCNPLPINPPTCGEWKPDPQAVLKMLTCTDDDCHYFLDYETGEEGFFPISGFIGGWLLVGIVAASMSTGDGAILAMGTVWSHNILRKVKSLLPDGTGDAQLLKIARISSFFFAAIAAAIASAKPDKTGYFLIVAFDCVLAGGVVPLFAAIYWAPDLANKKGCTPFAAAMALLIGSVVRGVLEFTLPIDGLLLVGGVQSFAKGFGPAYFENFIADEKGFAAADDWGVIHPEECSCINPDCSTVDQDTCDAVTLGSATSAQDCIDTGVCKYLNKPDAYTGGVYYGPESSLNDGVPFVGPTSVSSSLPGGDEDFEELPLAATDGAEMCSMIDLDDWTGINSWIAPATSLLVLLVCTYLPLPDKYKYGPFPEDSWFAPKSPSKKTTGISVAPPEVESA